MPWNYSGWEAVIMWPLFLFTMYLVIPLVACWLLFGYAWLRGWDRPDITPEEIIKRITS
jgi:hypothetical protein